MKTRPLPLYSKTPGMMMLEAMGATIVDMRKPAAEPDEETKAAFTAAEREIIARMNAENQEASHGS